MSRHTRLGIGAALFVAACGACLATFGQGPPCPPCGPPFERAILFTGQATDWVMHIGVYDAAVECGYPPDVIIATSGGSLAAAVVAAYPDRAVRLATMRTEMFHRQLLAPTLARTRVLPIVGKSFAWQARSRGLDFRPPNLFAPAVFDVPQPLAPDELTLPFPTGPARPRVVIIAGRVEPAFFQPGQGDKYFTEAWFTDRDTARHLAGRRSVIGTAFPDSYVRPCVHLPGEVPLNAAVRASMAEPYMVSPARIGDEYYVGGGINLWPVELGRTLARRVMAARDPALGILKELGSTSAFGYRQRLRHREVEAMPLDVSVDLLDSPGPGDFSFWPEVHGLRLTNGVPTDPAEFQRKVFGLYNYGYERGRAAFARR